MGGCRHRCSTIFENNVVWEQILWIIFFSQIKIIKTEFAAYVYWFNNKTIRGSLSYKSLMKFKQLLL
jgi:hypothetical protein